MLLINQSLSRLAPPIATARHITSSTIRTFHFQCVTFRSLLGFGRYGISYHRNRFGGLTSITARPGVAAERVSHGWVVGSSSERVETRKLRYPAEWGSDQTKTFGE